MVLINKAVNEITLKLVYYGPGLCGKTTNLEKIYSHPTLENKGKMISMATETDRTLFFDFLPMELGTVGGQKIRVQLYTVPGQVFYDATRKLVLRGADGVVFVADSQNTMRESNLESLENLHTNLRLNRLDPEKLAIVYQYNKRDLPNTDTVETMNEYLRPGNVPVIEASAINGQGVTQTLRAAVGKILENLRNNVDVTVYEDTPLARPSMKTSSGATHASAGVPRVSVGGASVPRPEAPSRPPTQAGRMAAPTFAGSTPSPTFPGSTAASTFSGTTPAPRPPAPAPPPTLSQQVPVPDVVAPVPAAVESGAPPGGNVFEPEGATPVLDRQTLSDLLSAAEQIVVSLQRSLAAAEAQREQLRQALERRNG